jgi:hypothetical protein
MIIREDAVGEMFTILLGLDVCENYFSFGEFNSDKGDRQRMIGRRRGGR